MAVPLDTKAAAKQCCSYPKENEKVENVKPFTDITHLSPDRMEFVTPPNPGTVIKSKSSIKKIKKDIDGVVVRRRSVRNLNLLWQ